MKAKTIAIATALGVAIAAAMFFAYPAMASTYASPQSLNVQQMMQQTQDTTIQRIQLPVGQTINLDSIAGGYRQVGDPQVNGTATGSLSLQVTGGFVGGYTLSLNGGTISFGGNSYTIATGSAQLGPHGVHMVGQGQAGASAQFLFSLVDLGRFGTIHYGVLRVDLTTGSSQYILKLLVRIVG